MAPFPSAPYSIQIRSPVHVFFCEILSHVFRPCTSLFCFLDSLFSPRGTDNASACNLLSSILTTWPNHVSLRFLILSTCVPSVPTPSGLSHYQSCLVWTSPLFFLAGLFAPPESSLRPSSVGTNTQIHASCTGVTNVLYSFILYAV